MSHLSDKISRYNNLIYPWLTLSTVVLLLSEIVWPGFVRPYLNLGLWLLFWSASVILKLILSKNN